MSTLKVNTLQNTSGVEVYTAKAWVNFNGTGTVAIRASGNVSSITDQGTGQYDVNFISPMVDANYAAITETSAQLFDQGTGIGTGATTASTVQVQCLNGSTYFDANFVYVAIFR